MKKFKIKVQFHIEREYSDDYDSDMVKFHCNESCSCANNMIQDYLDSANGDYGDCACFNAEAVHVEEIKE